MTRYIEERRDVFGVEPVCRVLGVPVSTHYARRSRVPSARELADRELVVEIHAARSGYRRAYGARKTWKELKRRDVAVGRDRVARLMRREGLVGYRRGTRPRTTIPDETATELAQDLLKRTDETCRKFGTAQQCGEKAPPMGTAGPPAVYVPPPVTQRVLQLLGGIENYAAAPSATQLEQIKILQGLLTADSAESKKLTQDDLPALNKAMNDAGVPHIAIPRGGGAAATSD